MVQGSGEENNSRESNATADGLLGAYELAGLRMVPLKPDKLPRGSEWQKRDINRKEIERGLERGGGVGLQVGEISNWISAADLDRPTARRLAPQFLPETLKSGKES